MNTLQFTKHFTPAEANRTLPLVRRIVEDIMQHGRDLQKLQDSALEPDEHKQEVKRQVKTVNGFFAELEDLGCFYKGVDFETGMVDFPGIIEDEEVFLCWKSDEADIRWYHGIAAGFKGRKEIPAYMLSAESTTPPAS